MYYFHKSYEYRYWGITNSNKLSIAILKFNFLLILYKIKKLRSFLISCSDVKQLNSASMRAPNLQLYVREINEVTGRDIDTKWRKSASE